ncbi:TCR/Tet family MFS transporter [Ekhidna sp.]|uniref:TCR/Tet family MFS transporter n=1 Tax=Ekhidna sp. TaxID=2608089 RepID=UPI00351723C4
MRKKQAALGFIFVTVLIDIIGIGLIIPIVPELIIELTGKTVSEAAWIGGLLTATYAVMQFIFAPILGGLSDKFGRRPVLLIALLGLGLDYLVIVFAPTLAWLFVARMISGICGSSITVANAYIADISNQEDRAKNFGMIGAAFGLGFIIGPAIGGFLGEVGTRIPFLAAAILSLLNWLYGYFAIPESLPEEDRRSFDWKRANPLGTLKSIFKYRMLIGLILCLFLVYIAAFSVQGNWAFYTAEKFEWSPQDIGFSLTFVGIMVSLVQGLLLGPIIKKIGEEKAVYAGLFFNLVGLVSFAFATESWMAYAIIVPYAFSGLTGPSMQSIMTSQIPKNAQGELQGGLTNVLMITAVIGPPLMTGIFTYYTNPENAIYFPGAPFILASILAIIGFGFAFHSLRNHLNSQKTT